MRWPLVLATCVGCGLASVAGAQPSPARPPSRPTLVVRVTDACPVGANAEARFDTVLAATEREHGEVRVVVTQAGAGFALHFLADLPEGQTERTLNDPDCGALLSASVLLAAIALDVPIEAVLAEVEPADDRGEGSDTPGPTPPDASTGSGASAEPPPRQGPSSEPTPGAEGDVSEPPAAPAAPPWRAWAHASLGLGSRFLPALRPDGGVGLALFRAGPRVSLGWLGTFRWTGPEAATAPRSGVSARARALGVELGMCVRRPAAGWALSGCAGGRLWRVRGQGVGSDADRRDHALDVALVAQVGLSVTLHPRVALRAALGAAGHALRARLNVAGVGTLHTAPALQVEGSLALWVRLSALPRTAP